MAESEPSILLLRFKVKTKLKFKKEHCPQCLFSLSELVRGHWTPKCLFFFLTIPGCVVVPFLYIPVFLHHYSCITLQKLYFYFSLITYCRMCCADRRNKMLSLHVIVHATHGWKKIKGSPVNSWIYIGHADCDFWLHKISTVVMEQQWYQHCVCIYTFVWHWGCTRKTQIWMVSVCIFFVPCGSGEQTRWDQG